MKTMKINEVFNYITSTSVIHNTFIIDEMASKEAVQHLDVNQSTMLVLRKNQPGRVFDCDTHLTACKAISVGNAISSGIIRLSKVTRVGDNQFQMVEIPGDCIRSYKIYE